MPDMLVRLYELTDYTAAHAHLEAAGVTVRRAIAPEKHVVAGWVETTFGRSWRSECEAAFARTPVSCFIAVRGRAVVGFGCHDATAPNFFGPTGVAVEERGKGIGTVLLWLCLRSMREMGYGYAIIGGAGPTAFYSRAVGAEIIDRSSPGIYRGMVKG